MRLTPALCSVGLLVSLGLSSPALAEGLPGEQTERRPPQLSVEVGGSVTRMNHASTQIPSFRQEFKPVESRASAPRLSGGLHFNILRGSNRDDLWWTNGVDWYFANDVQVLSFRPGLEKRFPLSQRLTLGVAAFGAASEVSLPTGVISQNLPDDPNNGPQLGTDYFQARDKRWIFGAGGVASLQVGFGRFVYTRLQAGYTQYFRQAKGFVVTTSDSFSISLSGPFAGALVGVSL
ncbi:hypothetical protein [Pyxidicoccus xibeiensis]|uniref:hypothetical protein n=1 Tax=Pyxidicoccus xibeiensis TaxID=2906759 RepID=UPI0020A7D5A5|nr:hypothetical protein [Pyxidicoccus xibeiensis]MCP3144496.1 hypothetical protein [Pyxidicoccus xibeiensis]